MPCPAALGGCESRGQMLRRAAAVLVVAVIFTGFFHALAVVGTVVDLILACLDDAQPKRHRLATGGEKGEHQEDETGKVHKVWPVLSRRKQADRL